MADNVKDRFVKKRFMSDIKHFAYKFAVRKILSLHKCLL